MSTRFDALRAQARAILVWWRRELAALVPARWRAWFAAGRPHTQITLGETHVELARYHRGEVVELRADTPLAALSADDWQKLATLCAESRIQLTLPPAQQLTMSITLPHAALSRVDAAIGYQLARKAPIEPAALLWSRQIAERQPKACKLAVTLVRRNDAEAVQAEFAARDLARPTIVSSRDYPPQILLRGEDASLTDAVRRDRRAAWIALGLIVSIPLTSLSLLTLRRHTAEERLAALSSKVGSAARAAGELQAANDSARALQALARAPSATAQLARSAAELPDGTMLTGFAQRRGSPAQLRLTLPAGLDPATTSLAVIDARPLADGRTAVIAEVGG